MCVCAPIYHTLPFSSTPFCSICRVSKRHLCLSGSNLGKARHPKKSAKKLVILKYFSLVVESKQVDSRIDRVERKKCSSKIDHVDHGGCATRCVTKTSEVYPALPKLNP